MDWKKIMNKRRKKADRRKAETAEAAAKEEIQAFLTRLLPEINLRLLLDMETTAEDIGTKRGKITAFPERLLWVEAVTVTAYRAASSKEQFKKPGFIRIWKRLTGMLGIPRSFKK